ncbi:Methyltransferase domain family [Coleofasciculus chthonoplastes PCC 7420]|uniref:Methyltransferase domain family n=1 Tax=Coleofasciculus chthonoplastes PCC 7420 TaxID=118168 RepID=B4VUS3_9CYAN|nr:class I SAM-dependent methyltransferase [Coleofasciculus chthonoplastes]EDX74521.1 Methyltransferase domain family [Coleofasciculus chthonoplastes PCC 7420]
MYDSDYFNWQKNIGAFGGVANLFKFKDYIQQADSVLDFGCGGGYLLKNIDCTQKLGVEINDVARAQANENGIKTYKYLEDVPDGFATVVISNHALEHVECPFNILKSLLNKMHPDGKAIFVVPHQRADEAYHDNDINQHLYTWNPLTLGNLFKAAGYVNICVDVIRHKWPYRYREIYSILGQKGFDTICQVYALYKRNYQIRVFAERPK